MQRSAIREQVDFHLTYDLEKFDLAEANDDEVVDWAVEVISKRLFLYEPSMTVTLTDDVAEYAFDDTTAFPFQPLTIDQVTVGGKPMRDLTRRRGLFQNSQQFEDRYGDFRTATKATPEAAVIFGNSLRFNCKVNGTPACRASARVIDKIGADDADEPTYIPEELQRFIAYVAAIKHAKPTVEPEEAWTRLRTYDESAGIEFQEQFRRAFKQTYGFEPTVEK